ncbi:hypothetical protein WJX72_008140 [[Myrmecia] bisecta]|uniref:NADP-dependent oxidoreductase domain-containing protein n=1 Tax=[Myrmecia] bisecta TaxID=41462 RepID=A0AAW1P237_9CHLO
MLQGIVQNATFSPPSQQASAALPKVPTIELAPSLAISQVIKGCWQLSGGHRGEKASDHTAGAAAVQDFQRFAEVGVTTLDTADHYGPSEALIGEYLKQARRETQVLDKFCVFSGADMYHSKEFSFVAQSVNVARQRLGVPTVDLMQLYWQDYSVRNYVPAAQHLGELRKQGLIRHIGVTNFDVEHLRQIVAAGVPVVSNQVQYSLLDRRPDNLMVPFCEQHDIKLLPYGVVAGGFLSDTYLGLPASKVSVNTYSKAKYAGIIAQSGGWAWFQHLLETLHGIAQKHGVSISNVASRWVLDRPGVPAIIVGARNADHVQDHQRLFTFQLDRADNDAIQAVLDGGSRPAGDCYAWERGGIW